LALILPYIEQKQITSLMTDLRPHALASKAWPFEEARKLLKRHEKNPQKPFVLLETGYGPSGLPHIGTFGEVARTTMVRHAFSQLCDVPTRLIAFSDDMDGLRKVPDNVPNKGLLAQNLGKPLTQVPDPFEQFPSFAEHNNARLCAFLDQFGFEYTFMSSTQSYKQGQFDPILRAILGHYDAIMAIILPTLGRERQASYSPFLPICPKTGVVLQVPMLARDVDTATVCYIDPNDGEEMCVSVLGGACKLQWKVDWAMRWVALGVDYEMAGKDLMESVVLSSKISKVLGGMPPEGLSYELFLDQKGEKISKSKGNGITIEDWLTYASPESLSLFMYQKPREAKRLYFDVIPRMMDDYTHHIEAYHTQNLEQQLANPAYHIHQGKVPHVQTPVSFALLLNLVGAANTADPAVLWGYLARYAPEASPISTPLLATEIGYALAYYRDFVAPTLNRRAPTPQEIPALEALLARLASVDPDCTSEALQSHVYDVGKAANYENLRDWFKALYEILLGQPQGPRLGSFFKLYGLENSQTLIRSALKTSPH
jgi:lysyl-tRNA synthetase, class I